MDKRVKLHFAPTHYAYNIMYWKPLCILGGDIDLGLFLSILLPYRTIELEPRAVQLTLKKRDWLPQGKG